MGVNRIQQGHSQEIRFTLIDTMPDEVRNPECACPDDCKCQAPPSFILPDVEKKKESGRANKDDNVVATHFR